MYDSVILTGDVPLAAHGLTGMPAVLPALSDHQYYQLPELVGRMYDSVILSGNALRLLEDAWCEYARRTSLLRAGAVVRPLRGCQCHTHNAYSRFIVSP
jgi:hypothetical protein